MKKAVFPVQNHDYRRVFIGAAGLLSITCAQAFAADFADSEAMPRLASCGVPLHVQQARVLFLDIPRPVDIDTVDVSADSIRSSEDGQIQQLDGNVLVIRQQQQARADNGIYYADKEQMLLSGNVALETESLSIRTPRIEMDTAQEISQIDNADFYLKHEQANGHADKVLREGDARTILKNTTYTSCSPDDLDWQFRARELRLQHNEGVGYAKGMSLRFKNIPIFYFPTISFPLDDRRKSGFLLPDIGNSSDRGGELALPYYWNIAPQADATLTPRYMSKRGVQLQSEWRYLGSNSRNQLDYAFLNDQEINPDITDPKRQLYRLTHSGRWGSRWSTALDINRVSDPHYFNDLGSSLDIVSVTHLNRLATLSSGGAHWNFQARAQDYQTIDPTISALNTPYRIMPQLSFNTVFNDLPAGLSFTMETEFVEFDHRKKLTGQRLNAHPRLSWPLESAAGYIIPAISAHISEYRLNTFASSPEQTITRNITTSSLDAGLFFERDIGQSNALIQTLEPRIFYLNTPFEDQSAIPLFDTRRMDFSFAQLFRENTFSSIDRIADANQTTVALTSRIIRSATGEELFRGSIGQIRYHDDRKTILKSSENIQTTQKSDLVAEVQAQLSKRWRVSATTEWSPQTRKPRQSAARLQYHRDNDHIMNLTYRFRDNKLKQADFSTVWPLSTRWSAVARLNRSLEDNIDLERFVGLEYKSCCYSFRIASRRYLNIDNITDNKFDNTLYLQLSFTGFTSIGSPIGELLERGILGYQDQL